MTSKDLLSRAIDYVAGYSVDYHEAKRAAEYVDEIEMCYTMKYELSGMQMLLDYLMKVEEEDE